MVLYTIVKYRVRNGIKNLWTEVYCKIRGQLRYPPTEIHADLQNAYWNDALKYTTTCKWVCCFNDGPETIKIGPRGSRKFYRESILTQHVDLYQKHRQHSGVRGIKLLNDNVPAHKFATVQEYLKESGLDVLVHPPYSPALSPCDIWLFSRLQCCYESRSGISSAVYKCLQHIPRWVPGGVPEVGRSM